MLPLLCSFVDGGSVYFVTPFMAVGPFLHWNMFSLPLTGSCLLRIACQGGSLAHIMKYCCPDGMEEVSIATITREVLKALAYIHQQGGIHRDVKVMGLSMDRERPCS